MFCQLKYNVNDEINLPSLSNILKMTYSKLICVDF